MHVVRLLPEPYDSIRRDAGVGTTTAAAAMLGVWLVPGCLSALETLVNARLGGREVTVWTSILAEVPAWGVWALATPFILWAGERWPLERGPLFRRILLHVPPAVFCGAAYVLVATTTWRLAAPYPTSVGFGAMAASWFVSALPLMLLVYFGVLGSARAVHWFARHRQVELQAARLSSQLSEARLSALRMQLHPHFLFNSLNAVAVLVRDGRNEEAEGVLVRLAALLRRTLNADGRHRIRLAEEIDFIRHYLDVERVRFSDRLRVSIDIDAGAESALVPALVLQPLVENALRHGVGRRAAAGRIVITAHAFGDRLSLTVSDDGPGPGASLDSDSGTGVGLRNTRARLSALYGGEAFCILEDGDGGGARARIELPLQLAGTGADV